MMKLEWVSNDTKIKPPTSLSFGGQKREKEKQLDFALSQDKTLLLIYFDRQLLADSCLSKCLGYNLSIIWRYVPSTVLTNSFIDLPV